MVLVRKRIMGLITFILGLTLTILGLILTSKYIIAMLARQTIFLAYVFNIGFVYSILVNFGVQLMLIGIYLYFKNMRFLKISILLMILGTFFTSIFIFLFIGSRGRYFLWKFNDIVGNFIPYLIFGIGFLIIGIIGMKKDLPRF